jgi:hypothetical protein
VEDLDPMEAVMDRLIKRIMIVLVFAPLLAVGPMLGTQFPQGKAQDLPKTQNKQELGEDEVKQLLFLMDTDKNGKISKREWMTFMEAEFDRLDKNKTGELDPKELAQSRLRVRAVSNVGK